jgi:hypothetical protein
VGLRNWLKKLERDSKSDLDSFELMDGSRHYFAPGGEIYMYCWHCLEAGHPDDWPAPPETLRMVLEAKDPAAALESIWSPAVADIFPYSKQILIEERRLEPRSIVEGEDPYDVRVIDDLSEPG